MDGRWAHLHRDAHGVAEVDDDEGKGDEPLLPSEVNPPHFTVLFTVFLTVLLTVLSCPVKCLSSLSWN